jgi:hypothetical protein
MSTFVDALGNWNPQFVRECRGRLRPRSIVAAIGLSILLQALLYLFVFQGESFLSLNEQWLRICRTITWLMPYSLMTVGGYYLVNDLTQEDKRGTLNFIRLSPRPSHEILLGKVLGVPILLYLFTLTLIPLHVISGLLIGISPIFFLSYYLGLGMTTLVAFALALLSGLAKTARPTSSGSQATTSIGFAALTLMVFVPLFMFWHQMTCWRRLPGYEVLFNLNSDPIQWLYLPITESPWLAHGFTLANLAIVFGLLWQMVRRLFRHPWATLLSKRVSYLVVAYLEVLVWGFTQVSSPTKTGHDMESLIVLYIFNFGLFLGLIFALMPQRSQLSDWATYRTSATNRRLSLAIWDDKSPGILALGLNMLIAAGLIVPWILITFPGGTLPWGAYFVPLVSMVNSLLIYGLIVQIVFATKLRVPLVWGVGVLTTVIVVPLMLMAIFRISLNSDGRLMTLLSFLGYAFGDFNKPGLISYALLGWIFQWLLMGGLLTALNRQLRRLGA